MDRNFSRALKLVLKYEGGFVNDPHDPGGATNKGVTLSTFRLYVKKDGTVADLKHISDADVATCYRRHYWDEVRGDDLPDGVDFATFDFAINSGPGRAARFLQDVVGATPDGQIGPMTLSAVRAKHNSYVIDGLCAARLAFLKGLPTWKHFHKGWASRVASVRVEANKMAATAALGKTPVQTGN
jgi:lysozyme family protein